MNRTYAVKCQNRKSKSNITATWHQYKEKSEVSATPHCMYKAQSGVCMFALCAVFNIGRFLIEMFFKNYFSFSFTYFVFIS